MEWLARGSMCPRPAGDTISAGSHGCCTRHEMRLTLSRKEQAHAGSSEIRDIASRQERAVYSRRGSQQAVDHRP